jgi:glycine hydroxymethyltransferase
MSCELQDIPVVIARTGYTGENWGFEILVHPDHMGTLWRAILEVGGPLGVKPAGLACRDSTRIEAGLPLYGQELAGPLSVSPVEAGFPGYVKYHKPFFIGRNALLAKEKDRDRELIRFRCNQKRTRRPNLLDPVVDDHGIEVGQVTSCSLDVNGYLVGLALVQKRCCQEDYSLRVFPLQGKTLQEGLLTKNKVTLPVEVTVLSRFPEKEGQKPRWMTGED